MRTAIEKTEKKVFERNYKKSILFFVFILISSTIFSSISLAQEQAVEILVDKAIDDALSVAGELRGGALVETLKAIKAMWGAKETVAGMEECANKILKELLELLKEPSLLNARLYVYTWHECAGLTGGFAGGIEHFVGWGLANKVYEWVKDIPPAQRQKIIDAIQKIIDAKYTPTPSPTPPPEPTPPTPPPEPTPPTPPLPEDTEKLEKHAKDLEECLKKCEELKNKIKDLENQLDQNLQQQQQLQDQINEAEKKLEELYKKSIVCIYENTLNGEIVIGASLEGSCPAMFPPLRYAGWMIPPDKGKKINQLEEQIANMQNQLRNLKQGETQLRQQISELKAQLEDCLKDCEKIKEECGNTSTKVRISLKYKEDIKARTALDSYERASHRLRVMREIKVFDPIKFKTVFPIRLSQGINIHKDVDWKELGFIGSHNLTRWAKANQGGYFFKQTRLGTPEIPATIIHEVIQKFENLKEHSSDYARKIPSFARKFIGDQRINFYITNPVDESKMIIGIQTKDMVIVEIREGGILNPTMNVYTDSATLYDILYSDEPNISFQNAIDEGLIKYKGIGIIEEIKLAAANLVVRVYKAVRSVLTKLETILHDILFC